MSYLLMVSEAQRVALLDLIVASGVDSVDASPGDAGSPAEVAEDAPLRYWVSMLEELPDAEADSPGVVHGFCL